MAEDNKQNDKNRSITVSDYQELMEFLVGQFDKVNDNLDQKADKSDIDKIYQILETKSDKADIDRVLSRVATQGSKTDDYRAEQIGM